VSETTPKPFGFPRAFWAANTMEIFERMAWYGFYALSSLYLQGAVAEGGLGLTSAERGVIQGVVTFFLYLFPAVFGALADRYGYMATFLASCGVMFPGYLLLGLPDTFWGFFGVYMLVAIGHGMFKPVVISTIAKTTDERTGTIGFGIFYMMVNIGGFLGPIVAGVVRSWTWDYVFYASAAWVAGLALVCLLFYREPPRDVEAESRRSLGDVARGIIELIGNGRFFLFIVVLMVLLVLGSKWIALDTLGWLIGGWVVLNLLLDAPLRARGSERSRPWFAQPMRVGETRYLLFLALMAGFWISFNQIFMTLPLYIRDYVDTNDLERMFNLTGEYWLEDGTVKPEYLVNLNALGIIVGQVLISWLARNLKPFTTIISGVMVTVISFFVLTGPASGWWVVAGILVFSVGEMLASPKSKEYAGRIAPPDKVGMYMGYFYWCVALGNLFGGLLSGVTYGYFGPEGIDNPDLMWVIFALLAVSTAILLAIYDRWVKRNPPQATS
jgi:dipeptide/tripeptide permease